MLAGGTGQSIRTLKSIGPFHSQVPVIRCSRSTDRHAPCALATAEGVLEEHCDFPAQLSVTEILQLNRDSHLIGQGEVPICSANGHGRTGSVFQRIMNSLIHKSC